MRPEIVDSLFFGGRFQRESHAHVSVAVRANKVHSQTRSQIEYCRARALRSTLAGSAVPIFGSNIGIF